MYSEVRSGRRRVVPEAASCTEALPERLNRVGHALWGGVELYRENMSQYRQHQATPHCLEIAGLLGAARDGRSPEEQDSAASTLRPLGVKAGAQRDPSSYTELLEVPSHSPRACKSRYGGLTLVGGGRCTRRTRRRRLAERRAQHRRVDREREHSVQLTLLSLGRCAE